jgi:hypothetical protein
MLSIWVTMRFTQYQTAVENMPLPVSPSFRIDHWALLLISLGTVIADRHYGIVTPYLKPILTRLEPTAKQGVRY